MMIMNVCFKGKVGKIEESLELYVHTTTQAVTSYQPKMFCIQLHIFRSTCHCLIMLLPVKLRVCPPDNIIFFSPRFFLDSYIYMTEEIPMLYKHTVIHVQNPHFTEILTFFTMFKICIITV